MPLLRLARRLPTKRGGQEEAPVTAPRVDEQKPTRRIVFRTRPHPATDLSTRRYYFRVTGPDCLGPQARDVVRFVEWAPVDCAAEGW